MIYQKHKNDEGKYEDFMNIIYRDLDTDEKKLKIIKSPEMDIYFCKEEYRDYDYNKSFIEIEKTDKVTCKCSSVLSEIYKRATPEYQNMFKTYKETGNYKALNNMYHFPYSFGADIGVEAYYRMEWADTLNNDRKKTLHKQFLDIEVDTVDIVGFPENGDCPINAVTVVDNKTMEVYTFLLYNPLYKGIDDFISNVDLFIDDLHQSFDDIYGVLKYNIYMYYNEKELLIDLFKLINTLKADFMLIWNGFGFDVPYIIDRLKVLGLNPEEIMTHNDFPVKTCYFRKDTKHFKISEKSDIFNVSSYTKYIDQMHLYASIRKSQSEIRSYSLNYIGKVEIDDEKIDYTDDGNMKTLVYNNYSLFVKYNIKDTLLQYGIEKKVQDVDSLYSRCDLNFTSYDDIFKQTVTLKNRAYYEYKLQGCILGNNVNIDYSVSGVSEKVKFKGALVGHPLLNTNTGIVLFGKKSKYAHKNVIDMDFSSMYPFIMVAFNIERNTMVGKLIILDEKFNKDPYENIFIDPNKKTEEDDRYCPGQDFMDNYLTGDMLSLGTKWFGLPTFDELHDKFTKENKIRPKNNIILTKVKRFIERFVIGAK
jgi:DNA polymerase elongation subunit (family B)